METLTDIWGELGERLRRFVGSRVRDEHAVDDVVQDVMLKVQSQLGDTPPEQKVQAWFFAVARNAIIDHYRSRAVRDHADIDDLDLAAARDEADRHEVLGDLAPCLARMIEHLPEPYRAAMKMADLQGLSQREVADRAGISLSGAKSRVQRSRQMLRGMIVDCCKIERDARGNVVDYETTERSSRYCEPEVDGPVCPA